MRSDVPLGAFLSGGIDSTIIAGLMQSLSEQPIHTFSIGFPVKEYDETSYAREAAEKLGTNHHEYVVEPSAIDLLPKIIWHYDEPFSDSSAIPTMYLSEVTRQEVTVALSGDGGDELFAGYPRYQAVKLASKMDWMPRVAASRCLPGGCGSGFRLQASSDPFHGESNDSSKRSDNRRSFVTCGGSASSIASGGSRSTRMS